MTITVGADPEFFLLRDKQHVSAIGLVGGTKDYPRPLTKEGCAVQEDNVSVEFNIAPSHNHKEFIEQIQFVLQEIQKELPQYEFSQESAVLFAPTELQHPNALVFGCEPDFNAWTKEINPRPQAADAALRSAGGHVHVGTDQDPIEVIRAMDLFLGVPSVEMDPGTLRRQLYGKAGAFRPKNYGCEYRTLSNFWIWKEKTMEWVFQQAERAVAFVKAGNHLSDEEGQVIQACINNGDKDAYNYLVKTYGLA